MIQRECGVFKTSYEADMALYPLPIARWTVGIIGVLFFLVIPLGLHDYYLSICNLVWIAVIGALGLNILVGYTGQVSIGHGAFMSVGAYTAATPAARQATRSSSIGRGYASKSVAWLNWSRLTKMVTITAPARRRAVRWRCCAARTCRIPGKNTITCRFKRGRSLWIYP